jgi:outer membrane receptor protein involved in Fe transport
VRFNIPNAPTPRPAQPPFVFNTNSYIIEEARFDPYVMLSGESGALKWEAGLRYETTDTTIAGIDNDFAVLLPSASLRYRLSDSDRLTLSVARTVRRADFDDLAPVTLEEERGDNDFRGNPLLEPETAWGVDLGFERRLGRRGVIGINAFYRDVTDLIEDVNTGLEGSGGPGTFIESIDNVGDGQVYGLEFDLSTPLDFIGMESTGVFLNASWLDSNVEDALGERRFNDQSDYVYNFGFTHDISTWGAAFGATYRKQAGAFGRVYAEEVGTAYGADLEVFIEKQIFSNTVIRLTGSNLLDSSKDEGFDKFNDQDDQENRVYDEYELETESAGPVYQLVMRVAF